jgi:hypothetical protein
MSTQSLIVTVCIPLPREESINTRKYLKLIGAVPVRTNETCEKDVCNHGRMQDFNQGQISDCNSLSGLNPLTNRVLNKK